MASPMPATGVSLSGTGVTQPHHMAATRGALVSAEDFRQLRHQTKNALQRLLDIVGTAPELDGDAHRRLRDSLQHRILASAKLSDALFGFTRAPRELQTRLRQIALGLVDLIAESAATITIRVGAEGACPLHLHDLIVRVTHELVGNAVKHGMYQRLLGTIDIRLRSTASATTLVVFDDGWGCGSCGLRAGDGLSLVASLLEPHDGAVRITRDRDRTVATAIVPHTTTKM